MGFSFALSLVAAVFTLLCLCLPAPAHAWSAPRDASPFARMEWDSNKAIQGQGLDFVPPGQHSGIGRSLFRRQAGDGFCRYYDHQSVMLDDVIYIEGGLFTYEKDWKDNSIYFRTGLTSINTRNGFTLPVRSGDRVLTSDTRATPNWESVRLGALWTDGVNKIYKFGGAFVDNHTWTLEEAQVRPVSLWQFSTIDSEWTQLSVPVGIVRAAAGSYVSVPPPVNKGFYIGGYIDNTTDTAFASWLQTAGFEFIDSQISFDFASNNLRNDSITPPEVGNVLSTLIHIPEYGKQGILISLGGVQGPRGVLIDSTNSGQVKSRSLDTIFIYDIAGDTWYSQRTSSTSVPPSRGLTCAVVVNAEDNSSINIVMYGGYAYTQSRSTPAFGDTYILSLPSFTWLKVDDTGEKRMAHTCHLAKKSKMVIIGGRDEKQQTQGDPTANYSVTNQGCSHDGLVSVFNLNTFLWESELKAVDEDWLVPRDLSEIIGGGPKGQATLVAPVDGFDSPELVKIFKPSTTKPNGKTDGKNLGPIIGGAVGGVLGFALLVLLAVLLYRHLNGGSKPAGGAISHPAGGAETVTQQMHQDPQSGPQQTTPLLSQPVWNPLTGQWNTPAPQSPTKPMSPSPSIGVGPQMSMTAQPGYFFDSNTGTWVYVPSPTIAQGQDMQGLQQQQQWTEGNTADSSKQIAEMGPGK